MIQTFKDAEAQKIYQRERSGKLPSDLQQAALRKLRMINNAININDLRIPPVKHLEKLSGARAGQYIPSTVINCDFSVACPAGLKPPAQCMEALRAGATSRFQPTFKY